MPELRIDPLSGAKAIIAADRAGRPGGGPSCSPAPAIDPQSDPFAEGNEDRTPPELYALRPASTLPDSPGWQVRVVRNLFPALSAGDTPATTADRTPGSPGAAAVDEHALSAVEPQLRLAASDFGLLLSSPAQGAHEVIINAPQSVSSLAELTVDQLTLAMQAWRLRMRRHSAHPYIQLIVNERTEAGASLAHTHAQLYALSFVPAAVARERERFAAFANRTTGHNLLTELLAEEVRRAERVIAIDDEAVLLAPYASRVPYQMMLAPRDGSPRFEQDGPLGAKMLHAGLRKLAGLLGSSPPLNIYLRSAPAGAEHFGWHLEILPRLTHIAGLELSTDIYLNIVSPEQAAAALREH